METAIGKVFFRQEGADKMVEIGDKTLVLNTTSTRAGYGVRHWYQCPHCHSRCAHLFIGKQDLACRKCWDLHYASQSEDVSGRLLRSVRKQRLDIWKGQLAKADCLYNSPVRFPKPKRMSMKTFQRKLARLLKTEAAYWKSSEPKLARGFGRVMRRAEAAIRSAGWEEKNHTQ
ncbi:hypothetical protein [Pantoea sp.]|uniref:hypothetical protein n=1 Tax=Pantoea sp. TaxID=69393 RepID=UPI0028ACEE85|nr:hypothetical protein [Pantoea sp.]